MSRDDQPTDLLVVANELATEPVVDDEPDAPLQFDLHDERYRVLTRLGKGGMGEVMAVRDSAIGREVALKRIRKSNPSDSMVAAVPARGLDPGRVSSTQRSCRCTTSGAISTGVPFFTMKKLTGTTLVDILDDRERYPLQRLLRAFAEVCLAIEFAHVRGIIHRDLKPENIVLGEFGEVYVLDWGVAKVVGEHDPDFTDVVQRRARDASRRVDRHAGLHGARAGPR